MQPLPLNASSVRLREVKLLLDNSRMCKLGKSRKAYASILKILLYLKIKTSKYELSAHGNQKFLYINLNKHVFSPFNHTVFKPDQLTCNLVGFFLWGEHPPDATEAFQLLPRRHLSLHHNGKDSLTTETGAVEQTPVMWS